MNLFFSNLKKPIKTCIWKPTKTLTATVVTHWYNQTKMADWMQFLFTSEIFPLILTELFADINLHYFYITVKVTKFNSM